ncbi:MFS transporter [Paenibacillus agri]|nr:MFS transporter [Paenibacillus agri]
MMSVRTKRIFSFTAIVLGFFMALLDTTIINVALPEMTKHFGGTVSQISWVMNGYNLAFAALILTASRLADQFGRRRLFLIGIFVFTAASLFAGFSSSLEMLIVLRVIQGLAGAIIVPVTIPLTTTTFPKEMHGLIIGIWGAVGGLAAASGPALGGILTEKLNWEWIFWVNVPLGILSIILVLSFIKESRDSSAGRTLDFAGMAGISVGMFLITYALIKVQDYGWQSGAFYGLLTSGVFVLLFFFVTQWKGKEPMMPLSLFRIRPFNGAALTLLIVGAGLMNLSLRTSFFLTRIMGMTELKAGLVLSVIALGSILSSGVSGPLSSKYGSRWFAAAGVTVMAGATYALSGLQGEASLSQVLITLGIAGLGMGLVMAPVMSSAIRNVPEEKVGISSGITNMTKALGSVLGIAIIVTVLQQNFNDRIGAAAEHAAQSIRENAVLQPIVKQRLGEELGAMVKAGSVAAPNRAAGGEISQRLNNDLEKAVLALPEEERSAFKADQQRQLSEIQVLMKQAEGGLRDASVEAFSRTYAFASILLLPGIVFALFSDQRRKRSVLNEEPLGNEL